MHCFCISLQYCDKIQRVFFGISIFFYIPKHQSKLLNKFFSFHFFYVYCMSRRHCINSSLGSSSYFEHRGLLLTDENTDVWVSQVGAVNLLVSASRVDVRKGFVDLQGPDAFIVYPVRGDASLLAQGPQADGPIRATRQALRRSQQQTGIKEVLSVNHIHFR